ncbi:MAG: tRNA (adenosine(37)-N6)-threonylcarbamoyltransferase complex ATPase subunit type 1 TsaE [Casimicrobiaceae bacterium]|nr:tRNA (adenosine(37)-N6)-threonylcarbamoyltransferase complex ATPase subunit type 1 TsaE [Casimicrobiaceae bacterium]MDW8311254.1 tRNA (adenosine(37)-N6)-threonylcarbamoyltransferase complex ATPase subunit type 1 TsaE [Burkholderiales bacterium]
MTGIVGSASARRDPWSAIGRRWLADEAATRALGAQLAQALVAPCRVALIGELGAGKTTLVRGFLRALGVTEAIKSPTYSLVETYATPLGPVHHLDCYRIESLEDFEARGGFDYLNAEAIVFVEWPERLAHAVCFDGTIELIWDGEGRLVSSWPGYERR